MFSTKGYNIFIIRAIPNILRLTIEFHSFTNTVFYRVTINCRESCMAQSSVRLVTIRDI